MKYGIDARFYGVNAGIGRYLRNLITELQKIDSKNEYYIFLLKDDLKRVSFNKNFTKVEADFSWYGFEEQIKLPKLLAQYNLDLVHFPHFNVPILYGGKFVVTIHDLIHLDFKMARASTRNKMYYEIKHKVHKGVITKALKKSQKVITVSEYVRGEILKKWRISESKIEVIYEGVEEEFINLAKKTKDSKKALEKLGIRAPYIYYIGAAHPHKNVESLIEAFLLLRNKYQYLTLVLAGEDNYFWQLIKARYRSRDIKYLGLVTDKESVELFKSAECLVVPSFSEGFGLPILEAFVCGCPVVSSNKGSLPEVGGDSALYFDPFNKEEMINQISQLLNSHELRKTLISKGLQRYKDFSFKKMAQHTLKVYNEVV